MDREAVLSHNDVYHWSRLQMLSKCILWLPSRGGKRHSRARKSLAEIVDHRISRWKAGEIVELWAEVQSPKANSGRAPFDADKAAKRRAERLASERQYSRACQALGSSGVHFMTEEVIARLRELHPQSGPPVTLDA